MAETEIITKIYDEVKSLKKEIIFIKTHMFDPDTIMTTEEHRRYEECMKELKEGKTTCLLDLKRELGI